MTTEEGIVTRADSNSAWIKVAKTGACESCSVKSSCNVMGGGEEMEVRVINDMGARIDDRVMLSFKTSSLLKASFLLYMVPIISLITGAVIGQAVASFFAFNPSICSAVLAFSFFILAILYIKLKGNELATRDDYKPKVTRILKRSSDASGICRTSD